MRITLISGTNRAGSRTLSVTRAVQRRFEALGAQTQVVNLQELPLDLLSPGAYDQKPATFQPFVDSVLQSDGLFVVAPEYNGSYPGVLKLFIDMLPFPESFEARPVAFLGLAGGKFGNLRGIEQLQTVFGYRNAYLYPKRIFITGASKATDSDGNPIDPDQNRRIQQQIEGYTAFIRNIQTP